jgi:hypothetical protein
MSTAQSCRTCGKDRVKSWCVNSKCEEYQGELHLCRVDGCNMNTPHVLCRTHWFEGMHCGKCARELNYEGHCLKCEVLLACVVDGCSGHAKWVNDDTIPLCKTHFGTRICFDHNVALDHGICPLCPDSVKCVVTNCKHPTTKVRPLCIVHHKGGLHCQCGDELCGLSETVTYCPTCDEHWKCARKGCKTYIAAYKYCKKCYEGALCE